MKTRYEMLMEVKKYYPLYIMKKSFRLLMVYMSGYSKCLVELFAGTEDFLSDAYKFSEYVFKHFKVKNDKHNWKEVVLFESHTDENAFDVFFELVDNFMNAFPEMREKENVLQSKYHKLQLNPDLEKVTPGNDYRTTINIYEDLRKDLGKT